VTIKSDVIGELHGASRVQCFEIRGIEIFFCWNVERNLFSNGKELLKGACLVGEMMKCECYQSQW